MAVEFDSDLLSGDGSAVLPLRYSPASDANEGGKPGLAQARFFTRLPDDL